MTDNEIIKALECCKQSRLNQDCLNLNCPFATKYGCNIDNEDLRNAALDLINRQKEEKEALIAGQETMSKYIEEQQAENERLQGWQDLLKAEKHSLIKAEAVKEFAERLKEEFGNNTDAAVIWAKITVDNILKEMGVEE